MTSSEFFGHPFLVGERILLRALTEEDCSGRYPSWFNDQEVCRYNSHFLFPYRQEDSIRYVRGITDSTTDLVLAIAQKKENRHIGNVSLQNIDVVNQTAEFSILIGEKDCWGKGYSREAGRLILDHGFRLLNLNRIYCGTPEDNIPMKKLALSLGMKEEGRRRQALFKEGRTLDIVEFGILREDVL